MKRENLPRAIVLESEIKNLEGLEKQLDNPTLRIGVYNPLSKSPVMEFQNNTDAESNEILANQRRDVKNNFKAKRLGWNIITIWECELRSGVKEKTLNELVQRIIEP